MSQNPEQHRRDPNYKAAKRQGYRARSAFKLFDIQKRFNIFKRAFYILDIGSTPGSWLQVAKKFAEENLEKYKDGFYHRNHYKIMGVDMKKVSPIENVEIVKMDATTFEFQEKIEKFFEGKKLDLILSDVSINKSGNRFSDQARQFQLQLKILEITRTFLKIKGIFVLKVFQGADFNTFFKTLKKNYVIVKSYKPKASNKKSNEIYIIAMRKKRNRKQET